MPTPPACPQPQAPFTPAVTDQQRTPAGVPEPKNRALTSGFGRRARTTVRAALSHHNDEGGRDAFPVVPGTPQAAHRDPLNTLAGTLADPADQAWGPQVKPEVAG